MSLEEASKKWEYATIPVPIHNSTAILNLWGKKGFELVQVTTGPEGGLVAFLKKPLTEEVSE